MLKALSAFMRVYGYSCLLSVAMVLGLYIATCSPTAAEVIHVTWSWHLAWVYSVTLSWVMLPPVAMFTKLLKVIKGELYV